MKIRWLDGFYTILYIVIGHFGLYKELQHFRFEKEVLHLLFRFYIKKKKKTTSKVGEKGILTMWESVLPKAIDLVNQKVWL